MYSPAYLTCNLCYSFQINNTSCNFYFIKSDVKEEECVFEASPFIHGYTFCSQLRSENAMWKIAQTNISHLNCSPFLSHWCLLLARVSPTGHAYATVTWPSTASQQLSLLSDPLWEYYSALCSNNRWAGAWCHIKWLRHLSHFLVLCRNRGISGDTGQHRSVFWERPQSRNFHYSVL